MYDWYMLMEFWQITLVISYNDYNKPWKIQSKFHNGVLVNNRRLKVNLINECAWSILKCSHLSLDI